MDEAPPGALSNLFVIELGDEGTQICGKQFADMGATVIKVEPPQGAGARHRGPYKDGVADPNASIYFWAHNTSKDSVTLDLADPGDRARLLELVRTADVVLEDFEPGTLNDLGLGYRAMATVNQRVIVTSVTPFGQDGPRSHWKGGDIVAMATGGAMHLIGYGDSPPLLPQAEISFQIGAQWAMMGTLVALAHRDLIGEGQHVDVSLQEAVAFGVDGYDSAPYQYMGAISRRREFEGDVVTKDGKYLVPQTLNVPAERWLQFRDWLRAEGVGPLLWEMDAATLERSVPEVRAVAQELAANRTGAEMLDLGARFGFTWMSVNAPEDLFEDAQLRYRQFFREVEHPELGRSYLYGGPVAEWSEAGWRIRRRAPLVGEDNDRWLSAREG
jgi:benzylsuccinate CoA-transferase BbsE subunit